MRDIGLGLALFTFVFAMFFLAFAIVFAAWNLVLVPAFGVGSIGILQAGLLTIAGWVMSSGPRLVSGR